MSRDMHPAVRAVWVEFNEDLEGVLTCLYADTLGLITTGMGNLVDPVSMAVNLPWVLPDGSEASRSEILAAWYAVKRDPLCASKGWTYAAKLPQNDIRLPLPEVHKLIARKLEQNAEAMAYRFDHWDEWPADAQLGVLSMAWAMGPGFVAKFPMFTAACRRKDFVTAAKQCIISPAKGTVIERNLRNLACFENAASVMAAGADVSQLVWPGTVEPPNEVA